MQVVVNVGWSLWSQMRSGLRRSGKNSTPPDCFHFQTCSLQPQLNSSDITWGYLSDCPQLPQDTKSFITFLHMRQYSATPANRLWCEKSLKLNFKFRIRGFYQLFKYKSQWCPVTFLFTERTRCPKDVQKHMILAAIAKFNVSNLL